jgi:hypothetical protein
MSMRLLRMMLALIAMAAIGAGSIKAAAAQDGEDEIDFSQLDGIEQVAGRSYTVDFAALMASPEAAAGEITYPSGVVTAYAVVAKFDGDDNAEAGWDVLRTSFDDQAADVTGVEASEITELEVDDLGDAAAGYSTSAEEGGSTLFTTVLIAREGEHVYVSVVSTGGDDPTEAATTLTEEMMDADAGDGEGEANDEGVYSGGLWDKFPGEDDDFAEGLTIYDTQIYPETEEAAEE